MESSGHNSHARWRSLRGALVGVLVVGTGWALSGCDSPTEEPDPDAHAGDETGIADVDSEETRDVTDDLSTPDAAAPDTTGDTTEPHDTVTDGTLEDATDEVDLDADPDADGADTSSVCDPTVSDEPCYCDLGDYPQGLRRFCCTSDRDVPYGCAYRWEFSTREETRWVWFDMSTFGSICGGRDFPREEALPSCPWEDP